MTGPAPRLRALAPALVVLSLLFAGCSAGAPADQGSTSASAVPAADATCAPGAEPVGPSSRDLQRALDAATPGDVLQLADTTYVGAFTITRSGTADDPIVLCGTGASVLDGGGIDRASAALRLAGAEHWVLTGFSVADAPTGIVLDEASHNELRELEVSDTGGQGIRLRSASSQNLIVDSVVRDTGVVDRDLGEGIAIGSTESTWCRYSRCEPDASDGNVIVGTTVDHTAGEAISAEEGTSSGVVRDNRLARGDGTSTDAVVDLKGNGWTFAHNEVGDAAGPGVQVHSVLPEWGLGNSVVGNTFGGSAEELVIDVVGTTARAATEVGCDNAMTWGPPARANTTCS
ncbi:right-handed parallel beta-helix repeat-containing protein [Microbacterium sp. 18062]|uniref:right-handed parallel beta-helix repeat-containing protein n=1 Tax=Microbacterium sp. 18062 TaxID=2681410 RepID=UPI001357951E|nr:right-handed parallel beta-helix repeat-containing protein [Microbacterium sp. 18062]